MRVKQLDLTFQSREGVKLDNKDLVSSMIGSVVESLVSSSELARSFYENEKEAGEEYFDTEAKDGVKAFTKVIDAIVSRFCLELIDTTIRLENQPKPLSDMVRFMDEQMRNCQQEDRSAETITSQPHGMGSIANLNKYMDMSGVELFTDIFTELEDQYSDNSCSQILTRTWSRRDDFQEFDSINLEDNRSSRKLSEACRDSYSSKEPELSKKESTLLSAKIGTLIVYIPHYDMMSVECMKCLSGGCREAVDRILQETEAFFAKASRVSVKPSNLNGARKMLDSLYSKDHIRIVGTSVVFNYEMDKNGTGDYMKAKLIFPSVDVIEYLTSESNPRDPEHPHIPLLDFSKFENPDQEPQLKVVLNSTPTESKAYVYIGKCMCELDLSIVDRITDIFEPRPFFDLPSYRRSRLDSIIRKDTLQLREDLFSVPIIVEQTSKLMVVVKCQAIDVNIRVPVADLRNPTGARLPYRQRHVHTEYIAFHISSMTMEVPVGGESTLLELFATEIYGSFCGMSDKFTCSDEDRRFLWGGQISVDEPVHIKFEYDPRNKALKASSTKIHCGNDMGDDMAKSISLSLLQSLPQREGPFAQTHRSFLHNHEEGNDLILAGSREEMTSFGAKCILQSAVVVSLDIPILRLLIPNHSFLEVLYNRLVNDLLLWKPAAPCVRPGDDEFKINALSEDMFHECGGDSADRYDDDCEEERFDSSTQMSDYDKNKSHSLSLLLNVKKATVLLCTSVSESTEGDGTGQVSMELSDAQLFTVAGYHGLLTDTYFYFTTHTVSVGHRNVCTMPKAVNQSDFGKWSRDDTQMYSIPPGDEFRTQSTDDAIGVAIYLCERTGQNVKDVLLAIAVRNSSVQLRPFNSPKETWAFQLTELFSLQDYPVPGYELPVVTTDLHIHLDNVVLAYDHVWSNPKSDIRLRLVLGGSDISCSIIQDMNTAKVVSIFEGALLFMSNAKKAKDMVRFEEQRSCERAEASAAAKRKFFKVVDVGLFQLEFLTSLLPSSDPANLTTPLLEIRCRNDIIKAWVCVDSLVALLNLASEISQSGKFASADSHDLTSVAPSARRSEDEASYECETPTSATSHDASGIPRPVEMKMKRMLASAMQEVSLSPPTGESYGIPCGRDALEEFSPNFSVNQNLKYNASVEASLTERNRAYSLSTDDEFCMVDEDVIGSGLTNATGEPNIKYIGSRSDRSSVDIAIDPQHFRIPSDWRGDGLAALPADFPSPVARYLLREISISLHLYGGSDLGGEPPKERSYSTADYREGKGKNQVVSPDAVGGKYRDHSVCVVLDLNKITCIYQEFDKRSPLMSMRLFTIQDVTLFDKLTASQIKEMMYQVSMLPIKFNIDQDTMEFLDDFLQEVRSQVQLPTEVSEAVASRPVLEVPATIRSNDGTFLMEKSDICPSAEKNSPLRFDVLIPDAAPPSPPYDLSYLESRTKSTSPVKGCFTNAPLTASAVSIGEVDYLAQAVLRHVAKRQLEILSRRFINQFSEMSILCSQVDRRGHKNPSSPGLGQADSPIEDVLLTDDFNLAGDWSSSSEIRFSDHDHAEAISSVEKLFMGASMHDSFHPDMVMTDRISRSPQLVTDDLVDTNDEMAEDMKDTDMVSPFANSPILHLGSIAFIFPVDFVVGYQ
ncbi:unnamed protein product [Heligmosomoides polygyrus]|uniref:Autophagy-related protein 2 n=1 Tax=Heligmosomoides polygyrus TaxID=6339 RepID=A0A3P7YRV4_HELPZ|nr:unnamed protein product [Heligmosomoides polygyrus]